MFLTWFWIEMTNIQVISKITTSYFSAIGSWRLFSATCVVTVVPHIHFCVSKFKHHELFCYVITLLIVLLIWTSEFNRSLIFSKQFLPLVVTCCYGLLRSLTVSGKSNIFIALSVSYFQYFRETAQRRLEI